MTLQKSGLIFNRHSESPNYRDEESQSIINENPEIFYSIQNDNKLKRIV